MGKLSQIRSEMSRVRGVVIFFIVLIVSNLFWKISVSGNEFSPSQVFLFGRFDLTDFFGIFVSNIISSVVAVAHFFGIETNVVSAQILHPNGNGIMVVWGCTAVKQIFIFCCLMLFAAGPFRHKCWYIPLGGAALYFLNIFRVFVLFLLAENHSVEVVDFWHSHVLKYAFYGVVFLFWLVWDLRLAERRK